MAEQNDIEQKVKITYETNADETSQEVSVLVDKMDDVAAATDKNKKATENLDKIEKSLRLQIKEKNLELQKTIQLYGETSVEAAEVAKKVAELKDQMGFAADLVDNFNPDQKFKALGAATQIAATGTSAIVSGLALVGDQSEDTQKILLKVQAAMAFSDSIKGLSELGDQWKLFRSVVVDGYNNIVKAKKAEIVVTETQTIAERIKNAVILSNPYIAIAAAIVAVTVVTYAWVKSNNEAAKAQEEVSNSVKQSELNLKALKSSIEEYNDATEQMNNIDVLQARLRGKSEKEVQTLIREQRQKTVQDAIDNDKVAYQNLLKAQEDTRKAIKTENDELIKKAQENQRAAEEFSRESTKRIGEAINDENVTRLQQQIDNNKKAEDIAKAAYEKRKAQQEKERAEREAAMKAQYDRDQQWLKMQNDAEKAILDEIDAAKKAYQDRLKTDEQRKLDDEQIRYDAQLAKAIQFNKDTEDLELEHINIVNDIKLEGQKKEQEQWQAMEDARLAYKAELTEAELNLASNAANFLGVIAGKNKALQKTAILAESGVAIGKMIIANNAANIGALATPQAIATSGASAAPVIAFNNISTGLGVAANLAATAKALSAVGAGGGGSGGGASANSPSAPGGATGSQAPQVQFQASSENQIANGVSNLNRDLPPTKAFVVQSEMTAAQEVAEQALNSNSLAGG